MNRDDILKALTPLEKALRDSCHTAAVEVDRLEIDLSALDLDEGDLDAVILDLFGIRQCDHCWFWWDEQEFDRDSQGLTCNSCLENL